MKLAMGSMQIVVVLVPKAKYETKINAMVSDVSAKTAMICYVSMNKPCATLGEAFKKSGVNLKKITFVDCVTGRVPKEKDSKVLTVSSPKALTELSIVMSDAMKKSTDFMIFDSLSTLLAYHDSATAIKFVHSIVSRVRSTGNKCVFICLAEDGKSDMMKDVAMFVDKVIKPGK